jgi:hypothetical protein
MQLAQLQFQLGRYREASALLISSTRLVCVVGRGASRGPAMGRKGDDVVLRGLVAVRHVLHRRNEHCNHDDRSNCVEGSYCRVIALSRGRYAGTPREAALDHQETYLSSVLGFTGITDVASIGELRKRSLRRQRGTPDRDLDVEWRCPGP